MERVPTTAHFYARHGHPDGPTSWRPDLTGQFRYKHDTDCLYWARGIYGAYQLIGTVQPNLRPSGIENMGCIRTGETLGQQAAFRCQILRRREKCGKLLGGGWPGKYLGMALGLTLDWIRYGWVPKWRQFVRKIHHDGTQADTSISGDGKHNTLYILIEAYRFTRDSFYLNIFDQAWGLFVELATDVKLGGFFPKLVEAGTLPADSVPAPLQEIFLDVIVTADPATADAGEPRADYLTMAEDFAARIIAAHDGGTDYYQIKDGVLGRALLRLALAKGTLRRVSISLSEDSITTLIFHSNAIGTVEVHLLGHKRAVVYINDGTYDVVKHFAGGNLKLRHASSDR